LLFFSPSLRGLDDSVGETHQCACRRRCPGMGGSSAGYRGVTKTVGILTITAILLTGPTRCPSPSLTHRAGHRCVEAGQRTTDPLQHRGPGSRRSADGVRTGRPEHPWKGAVASSRYGKTPPASATTSTTAGGWIYRTSPRSSGDHPAGGLSGITPAVSLGKSKNSERNSCHSLRACLSKEA
jgi:hypothetical protein